ncbi:PulJ/GspJ family protein [Emcibacter nanhaiensis]|uniref:Type II secretion system protein n=1 Tax=Emcibacter nanhaiensis TaxID=1505037 RepID=A0A501PI92_9PROT|nr:type II secretion system protein [Emcibacter nanhaiensis]TPD60159.1 type II secretion system protein [Emcibacter nanhaiensis]
MPRRPDPERGFTLLETLVALAILSLVMVAAFGGISDSLNRTVRQQQELDRLAQAENLMTRIMAGEKVSETGDLRLSVRDISPEGLTEKGFILEHIRILDKTGDRVLLSSQWLHRREEEQ